MANRCIVKLKVGDQVGERKHNIRSCKLIFAGSQQFEDACVQTFHSAKHAMEYYTELSHSSSEYLPKAYDIRVKRDEYLVVVEKMIPLDHWLNQPKKENMWKNRVGEKKKGFERQTYTYAVGHKFQEKLSQIMLGLEAIHKGGRRHLNLDAGVALGADGKIKLHNFWLSGGCKSKGDDLDKLDALDKLKEDFIQFKDLVILAMKGDKPLNDVDEVQEFFRLIDKWPAIKDRHTYRLQARWIYWAPLFWNWVQKRVFFDTLYAMMKSNRPLAIREFHLKYQAGWQSIMEARSPMWDTYYYNPKNPKKKLPKANNPWYHDLIGVPVLIRHFIHHCKLNIDPVDEAEFQYRGAAAHCYSSLSEGTYLDETLMVIPNKNPTKIKELKAHDYFCSQMSKAKFI